MMFCAMGVCCTGPRGSKTRRQLPTARGVHAARGPSKRGRLLRAVAASATRAAMAGAHLVAAQVAKQLDLPQDALAVDKVAENVPDLLDGHTALVDLREWLRVRKALGSNDGGSGMDAPGRQGQTQPRGTPPLVWRVLGHATVGSAAAERRARSAVGEQCATSALLRQGADRTDAQSPEHRSTLRAASAMALLRGLRARRRGGPCRRPHE